MNIYPLHINKLQQHSLIKLTPAANSHVSATVGAGIQLLWTWGENSLFSNTFYLLFFTKIWLFGAKLYRNPVSHVKLCLISSDEDVNVKQGMHMLTVARFIC